MIFLTYQPSPENLVTKYLVIYAPVRLIEWWIIAAIFRLRSTSASFGPAFLWSIGGIIISFAADLASPEGVAGHFCIGRCLC